MKEYLRHMSRSDKIRGNTDSQGTQGTAIEQIFPYLIFRDGAAVYILNAGSLLKLFILFVYMLL